MPKLSELKDEQLSRVFVMGEPGTGKTVFACSFPGPVLVFDFDGKVSSASSYYQKHNPTQLAQIEYEACSPIDQKGSSFTKMNNVLDKLQTDCPFKTIVIDSSTVMAEEMMNWLINFETGIARNTKIKSRKVACMQDYMIFGPTFKDFIHKLFMLPANIVMTGHVKVDKDELTGEIHRSAAVPGQMGKKLPIYFPEVYVSSVKNGKYMLQTQADYKYPCRSQIQGIPKDIESNYANLIKAY